MTPIKAARRTERREYSDRKAAYLEAHPLDQIAIALRGDDEEEILAHLRSGLAAKAPGGIMWKDVVIPYADQIHHRNKGRGARLNDERWWMSTSIRSHDFVEYHKTWARENGFLLPIQADADGRWGDGLRALETPEFMKARAGQ